MFGLYEGFHDPCKLAVLLSAGESLCFIYFYSVLTSEHVIVPLRTVGIVAFPTGARQAVHRGSGRARQHWVPPTAAGRVKA